MLTLSFFVAWMARPIQFQDGFCHSTCQRDPKYDRVLHCEAVCSTGREGERWTQKYDLLLVEPSK
jgi:hypothetical protein